MALEYSKVLIRSRLTSTFTRGERECKRNWRCVRRSPSVNNDGMDSSRSFNGIVVPS